MKPFRPLVLLAFAFAAYVAGYGTAAFDAAGKPAPVYVERIDTSDPTVMTADVLTKYLHAQEAYTDTVRSWLKAVEATS